MLISRVSNSRQQVMASYDWLSRWYDLLSGGFERPHREAALRMLDLRIGQVVLEIGIGTGASIETMARGVEPSGRVFGVDLSKGMLAVARRRIERSGVAEWAALQQADALRLPFAGGSFGAIFMCFTLELFDTPQIPLVLTECLRLLRHDGRMCVLGLSRTGGSIAMTRVYAWLHKTVPQVADCRPIFVERSLLDAGFRSVEVVKSLLGGLPVETVLAQRA